VQLDLIEGIINLFFDLKERVIVDRDNVDFEKHLSNISDFSGDHMNRMLREIILANIGRTDLAPILNHRELSLNTPSKKNKTSGLSPKDGFLQIRDKPSESGD
jgi:hypothetical protein